MRYEAYGLTILSDVPLDLQPAESQPVDLTFLEDRTIPLNAPTLDDGAPDVIASLGDDKDAWYVATQTPDGVHLSVRQTAEFVVAADLRSVRWRLHANMDQAVLSVFLSGTVIALVMTLQGRHLLHASAIAIGDQAIAFVGQSKRGKSTLAALGSAWGGTVVTDDILVVETAELPRCRGHGGELRIRPAVSAVADLLPAATAVRTTGDGRLALLPPRVSREWVNLAAVVIPRRADGSSGVVLERVNPAVASVRLLSMPRVSGITVPAMLRRHFEQSAELCSAVPVYDATIPWGPPFDAAHFAELAHVLGRSEAST